MAIAFSNGLCLKRGESGGVEGNENPAAAVGDSEDALMDGGEALAEDEGEEDWEGSGSETTISVLTKKKGTKS